MREPTILILTDNGDVIYYLSIARAATSIEAPDIDDVLAYGADGTVLKISLEESSTLPMECRPVLLSPTDEVDEDGLRNALLRHLRQSRLSWNRHIGVLDEAAIRTKLKEDNLPLEFLVDALLKIQRQC